MSDVKKWSQGSEKSGEQEGLVAVGAPSTAADEKGCD